MASRTLLRLNKVKIYQSYHGMQDRDAHLAIKQYEQKMRWRSAHKSLDIGCGPGDLTVNYLLPLIPQNGEMLGIDISQPMIQHANSKYDDPRLKFEVMDITNPMIREKYYHNFDSVFSFYCLHWIQDQWTTMRNIYDVLKPGGETLLIFLATNPIYRLYELLGSTDKWSPYMHDFKKAISPYHYSADPESGVRALMSDVGLNVKDCFCTLKSYTVPTIDVLCKSIQAVDPFLNRMPESIQEEYNRDCKNTIFSHNLCTESKETDGIQYSYSLITVYATKPASTKN